MICPACGHANPDTAKFCSQCAAPLVQVLICPRCGTHNGPTSKFCNECAAPLTVAGVAAPTLAEPTSFSNGRYVVKRFLGEGGKKRVYLVRDAELDRDVALALLKT